MKETYYKLNREKLREYNNDVIYSAHLPLLIKKGVLEEVQEEEWIEQIKADAVESTLAIVYKDELSDKEIENRKLQEESKQAIDNMFGNPLGQVDSLVASVEFKGKNNDTHTLQVYDDSLPIGVRVEEKIHKPDADIVVQRIIRDLADRSGISDAWENIDEDVQSDIIMEWEDIILSALQQQQEYDEQAGYQVTKE